MNETFADRVSALLQHKCITQKKFLEDIGISPNSFTKWKNGQAPNLNIINDCAVYLGVTTDFLITGNDNKLNPADISLLDNFHSLKKEYQDIILANIQMLKELS